VRGIDERASLEQQDALRASDPLGEVVGENAASHAGTHDHNVKVIPRAQILQEETLLCCGRLGHEIVVGRAGEDHVAPSCGLLSSVAFI
jgi:hypothetical protein